MWLDDFFIFFPCESHGFQIEGVPGVLINIDSLGPSAFKVVKFSSFRPGKQRFLGDCQTSPSILSRRACTKVYKSDTKSPYSGECLSRFGKLGHHHANRKTHLRWTSLLNFRGNTLTPLFFDMGRW